MNALYQAAHELDELMVEKGWRYCIIGGLAVVRWGQPRATQDVDASLFTGLGTEGNFLDALLGRLRGRRADAREFALRHRVLLVQASNGVGLDIALAAFPFEERVIDSASPFSFAPGATFPTASAEDLVILKAFADRDKDWPDIEGILVRQATRLDWTYVRSQLAILLDLKGDTSSLDRLERLRGRLLSAT